MNLKAFLAAMMLSCAVSPIHAANVAIILSITNDATQALQSGFQSALSAEGISAQSAVYNLKEKEAAAVAGLVLAQKPDVVLAVGSEAANLLKLKLSQLPGVYALVANNTEFVGANMTGVSLDVPASLRIECVRSVLADVKRVGVLYSPAKKESFSEISAACTASGLSAVGHVISSEADFLMAVQKLMGGQADCVLMIIDSNVYFGQTVRVLLLESIKNKVPVIGFSNAFTKGGAVMSVDCDYNDIGRQAGELSARILGRENPSAIKSQRPRKIQYSINMISAGRVGVSFPDTVVSGASEVIK